MNQHGGKTDLPSEPASGDSDRDIDSESLRGDGIHAVTTVEAGVAPPSRTSVVYPQKLFEFVVLCPVCAPLGAVGDIFLDVVGAGGGGMVSVLVG